MLKNVHFLGVLNEIQLVEFYSSLGIYVHTSYGETMSTSIMQAQASGLPIIASDVKGINNVIRTDVNGFLVELNNVEKLTEKIEILIESAELRMNFSRASRLYAEKHLSNEIMFEMYQKAFEE
jgi:glycosyltransferase involved in cell wall biosynthesis